ncbi:iron chaperone [Luteimonas gilva]|nr:DUF1801 domain-containing protein [Luteimonas gilva]
MAVPSKKSGVASVDAYIAAAAPGMAGILETLRAIVRSAAPEAEETMRMGTPTYVLNGPLVSFGAAAKHCAFYVMSRGPVARHKQELAAFDTAPSAIKFAPGQRVPKALIAKIVKERMQENAAR